jgi:hypothetical protein
MLSTNISDPCLLSFTLNEIPQNPPPDLPATGDQSTIDSEMNSLDSGILDEGSTGMNQVYNNYSLGKNKVFNFQNDQHSRMENSPLPEKISLCIGHEE